MIFKLVIVLAILVLAAADAQYPWEDGNPIRDYGIPLPDQCNKTLCHASCEGASPPATCPTDMPECPSGCACFKDCSTNILICFMTKHCPKEQSVTNHRHARAVEAADLDSVVQATGGHMEQELPASTVESERAEQNLPASTEVQAVSYQAEQKVSASVATHGTEGHTELDLPTAVTQTVNQSTEDLPASIFVRVEPDLFASTAAHKIDGRANPDLPASTDAHRIDGRAKLDLPASTVAQTLSGRKERDITASSHIQKIPAKKHAAEKGVEGVTIKPKTKSINAGVAMRADAAAVCVAVFVCLYGCIGSVLPLSFQ